MKKYYFLLVLLGAFIGYYFWQQSSNNSSSANPPELINSSQPQANESVTVIDKNLADSQVSINLSELNGHDAVFFRTKLSDGTPIEYFVVQDNNGVYRAAANACQVCFAAHQGFHQEGNDIVCNTCGNHYPLEKIATEKGGCNPGPINPNLTVANNQIVITESELMSVKDLF